CQDRVTNGEIPACVATCPTQALEFDTWEAAVEKAYNRVDSLKDRYPDANVYGDDLVGGTHYIYVLTEKPEVYGLPGKSETETSDLVSFRKDVFKPATNLVMGATAVGLLASFLASSATYGNEDKKQDGPDSGGEDN